MTEEKARILYPALTDKFYRAVEFLLKHKKPVLLSIINEDLIRLAYSGTLMSPDDVIEMARRKGFKYNG